MVRGCLVEKGKAARHTTSANDRIAFVVDNLGETRLSSYLLEIEAAVKAPNGVRRAGILTKRQEIGPCERN
jgi:hypothetical protein